jgi:hypothetical protein
MSAAIAGADVNATRVAILATEICDFIGFPLRYAAQRIRSSKGIVEWLTRYVFAAGDWN